MLARQSGKTWTQVLMETACDIRRYGGLHIMANCETGQISNGSSFQGQKRTITKQKQQQPPHSQKIKLILRRSAGFGQESVNTFVLSWRDAQYRPASPSSLLPVNGEITHQGQVLPVSHRVGSSASSSRSPIIELVSVLLYSSPDKTKLQVGYSLTS